jgi:P-type Cu2+ transporter
MEATPTKSSEATQLQWAMAIAGFAMGNIMLLSVTLWSSDINVMGFATRELLHWVSALIALPTIAYAGRPFFRSAYKVLKQGRTNMDVPISLALLLASGMSLFETMNGGEHAYFDSAVMLLFFLLVGRWLDAKARGKAHQHATELLELLQGTATLIKDGGQQTVLIKDLQAGDLVLVAAGEKIPSDSEVVSGRSEVDTSAITGESAPRLYREGEKVFGATINMSAPLICRILQASEDSTLAEVVRLMEQAEQGRAQYVRLADKAARLYTPVVHTLAALAFLGWLFIGGIGWQDALLIAITTLIITCPCALGLAVPVVQVLTVGWLMNRGILVKSADALEKLNAVNTVVLDKTGTLTLGKPKVKTTEGSEHHLTLAASLADHSKHPLSQAISAFVSGNRAKLDNIEETPGKGIQAHWKDHTLFLGKGDAAQPHSTTVVFLIDGRQQAVFTLADELRPDALETLKALKSAGLKTHLLSGDYLPVVRSLSESLNISDYDAEILPAGKLRKIKQLENAGNHCLRVFN